MFEVKMILYCIFAAATAECQSQKSLSLSPDSFRKIIRAIMPVPDGRKLSLSDTRINYYRDSVKNHTSYRIGNIKSLLSDSTFDLNKPTLLYAHGYVELTSDYSVLHVMESYIQNGGFNILALDWANRGFGDYLNVLLDIQPVGKEGGKAMLTLLKGGLDPKGLHLVGHSMGAHVMAVVARFLKSKGYEVPRLTCLDAAYPGFYPPIFMVPVNAEDARFVDIIHTDGGMFGVPHSIGHVDFWPNGGSGSQPGCPSPTVPFTVENFCSHDRSWLYWAESVRGGNFLARKCDTYDAFLRGRCGGTAYMGLRATAGIRGNYYLKTASQEPFALGERGAL